MSDSTNLTGYTAPTSDLYTAHGIARHSNGTLLLRDSLDEFSQNELRAIVASGEYFQTLATTLDQIDDSSNDICKHPELYKIIRELLYMQQHYTIQKES